MESFFITQSLAAAFGLVAATGTVHRRSMIHAASTSAAISLGTTLLALWQNLPFDHAAIMLLFAQLIALPLLDRARFGALVMAAITGGWTLCELLQWIELWCPEAVGIGWLGMVIVSSLVGLIGSACLPGHPSRARDSLSPVLQAASGLLLIATLGMTVYLPMPATAMAALSAAGFTLIRVRNRQADALRLTAQSAVAGVMLASLASMAPVIALGVGVVAAWMTSAGQRLSHALALDDPAQQLGTLLLPALAALLLKGTGIAAMLQWAGWLLAASLAISLLWPIAMLVFGLRASPRRVREGLDFHA